MTKITVPMLKTLRVDIEAALAAVGKQHGVVLTLGRCTYSDETATFKLEAAKVGDSGEVMTKDASAFKMYARLAGLDPTMLFKTVDVLGHRYKVVGYSPRRNKPVLAVSERDGRTYCFTAESIRAVAGTAS